MGSSRVGLAYVRRGVPTRLTNTGPVVYMAHTDIRNPKLPFLVEL